MHELSVVHHLNFKGRLLLHNLRQRLFDGAGGRLEGEKTSR